MDSFLQSWQQAAHTSLGLFWMAFWAFALGYTISAMIQVFVTRERMRKSMGESGVKSVALGTAFGFVSSSCSFSALSTTRALFAKGAGVIPSLAFLLASTNLVIELGIVIAVFLGWQFVVGEYVGGIVLILLVWGLVRATGKKRMIEGARERARTLSEDGHQHGAGQVDWREKFKSKEQWQKVASQYVMEWQMVWKDVAIGFTIAGIIAVFVPNAFFATLFLGAGSEAPSFLQVLAQTIIGPVAAFFTFIGSMGNIPLAAVLFGNGVSFAGVMAFIFSDLVVFPVLRIQAEYYGWKFAIYVLLVFLVALILCALFLHYSFALLGFLPDSESVKNVVERTFFKLDYTAVFNFIFLVVSAGFLFWKSRGQHHGHDHGHGKKKLKDRILMMIAYCAFAWLFIGEFVLRFFI